MFKSATITVGFVDSELWEGLFSQIMMPTLDSRWFGCVD